MEALKDTKTTTLGAALVDKIRSDIVRGVYLPNARLRLSELSERYNASPIPVREALTGLAGSGFVLAEPQRGFRVAPVSLEELRDITQCRIFTEQEALRQSLRNGNVEWEASVISAHHRLQRLRMLSSERAGMDDRWDAAHTDFHRALIGACNSKWLRHMTEMMREQTSRYRHLSVYASMSAALEENEGEPPRDIAGEHDALMQAALARDEDKAIELLNRHFRSTTDFVIRLIKTQSAEAAK